MLGNTTCETDFCLYNKGGTCCLKNISIDSLGNCEDCILLTIDEKFLDAEKEKQLADMESR